MPIIKPRSPKQSEADSRSASPIPSDIEDSIMEGNDLPCAEAESSAPFNSASVTANATCSNSATTKKEVIASIKQMKSVSQIQEEIENPFLIAAALVKQVLEVTKLPTKTVIKEQRQYTLDCLSETLDFLEERANDSFLDKTQVMITTCEKCNNTNDNTSDCESDFKKAILEEIKSIKQRLDEPKVRENPITYASALGKPLSKPSSSLNKPVMPKNIGTIPVSYSMIVKSEKLKTSSEIRAKITKEKVCPKAKASPKGMYNLGKDKVKLNFGSPEERDKVMNQIKELPDLKAEAVKKKNPLVILKWVPSWVTPDDIIKDYLIPQNERLGQLIPDLKESDFKIRFKIRPKKLRPRDNKSLKEEPYHLVIEVNTRIYRSLMQMKGISIDTKICQAQAFLPFKQCYKCCGFGHIAKHCDSLSNPPKPVCALCSGDHAYQDCERRKDPKRRDKPICFRCKAESKYDKNLKSDHMATSPHCPFVQDAKVKSGLNVDW